MTKEEKKAYDVLYRATHKEERRLYREEHKEEIRASRALYYEAHKEEEKESRAVYYETHKEDGRIYGIAYRESHREEGKEYREIHKEERNAYNLSYHAMHKEKEKEYRQTIGGKYVAYKRNAKRRKLSFDLTIEEFYTFWQNDCDYCGDAIITIGLDRIDSSLGYSINNCAPCCTVCNVMKSNLTLESFRKYIEKLHSFIPVIKNHLSRSIVPD